MQREACGTAHFDRRQLYVQPILVFRRERGATRRPLSANIRIQFGDKDGEDVEASPRNATTVKAKISN